MLREGYKLRVFENRVLTRMFESKRERERRLQKLEKKLGRYRLGLQNNIKMNLTQGVNWVETSDGRLRTHGMHFCFP
jgi:hypothetical protein